MIDSKRSLDGKNMEIMNNASMKVCVSYRKEMQQVKQSADCVLLRLCSLKRIYIVVFCLTHVFS